MGGTPKFNALCRKIDADWGGEDGIIDIIAGGVTQNKLAARLGVSRQMLYKWSKMTEGRREKYLEARTTCAGVYADESKDLLDDLADDPDVTSAQVSLARARSHSRQWTAGKLNPEKYGDKQVIDITVNAENLHLDAVRDLSAAFLEREREIARLGPGPAQEDEETDLSTAPMVVDGDYEIEEEA